MFIAPFTNLKKFPFYCSVASRTILMLLATQSSTLSRPKNKKVFQKMTQKVRGTKSNLNRTDGDLAPSKISIETALYNHQAPDRSIPAHISLIKKATQAVNYVTDSFCK